jgi:serine/threonine protein kinase/Tol biopolymer transport system component
MGDVYQAADSKLGRNVALKVLPETFAEDAERVGRLEREARMLAALNHPNIAFIFGLERAGARNFLVMELVDGETLAERIRRGSIPLDEALAISHQILEALEGAHEKGVIHRDLKPANIKINSEGNVKVLDFGLAKSMETESASAVSSNSPTLSIAATQAGVILGTAAYMSPEQAKGKTVDRRTDVFAFGCILYEMLTGRPAFDGDDVTEILGAVVRLEPDWSRLPANTPQRIQDLLRFCLEKNVKNRRGTATDVRLDIEAAAKEVAAPRESSSTSRGGRPLLAWVLAAALVVAVVGFAISYFRSSPVLPVIRFKVQAPPESIFTLGSGMLMEISPDGRYLAFLATPAGKPPQLFIRALDEVEARPIPGIATAARPFWSPDSRYVAYGAEGQLKKVDVSGGSPQLICNISGNLVSGAWGRDAILFSSAGSNGLLRVSPDGGNPSPLTTLAAGETQHVVLSFLPDEKHFLLTLFGAPSTAGSPLFVASVDSGDRKLLLNSFRAAFAAPDHFFFVRDHALFAESFNTRTFALEGPAVRILDSVSTSPTSNAGFSVSQNGLLVFAPGITDSEPELTWYDRSGKVLSQVGTAPYRGIDLSPDGKRVAVHRHADGASGGDVWIIDLDRNNTATRLTQDESQDNSSPIWSPDGASVAFGSLRNGRYGIYRKAANGVGNDELLFESETPVVPSSWAPDGKSIVFINYDPKTHGDLWILPLSGDRKPTVFSQSPATEIHAQISPDGHWVAYGSDGQIWVQSYPVPGSKYRLSTEGGGALPRWRGDGKELFFSSLAAGRMWSVSVSANGPGLTFSTPQLLFDRKFYGDAHPPTNYHTYAVSSDGERILAPRQPQVDTGSQSVTVVVNWTSLLKK